LEVVVLATTTHKITLEENVYNEFAKYVAKKGIKISTWINIKMKEFIEEEKIIEEIRKKNGHDKSNSWSICWMVDYLNTGVFDLDYLMTFIFDYALGFQIGRRERE
jgi:hypothetical protein